MNINRVISIILVVLGVLVASTAQLTDLVGPGPTKTIVSLSSLIMSILSGTLGILSGATAQVRAVSRMPGIDPIHANENATPAVAAMALDPREPGITAAPGKLAAVQEASRN